MTFTCFDRRTGGLMRVQWFNIEHLKLKCWMRLHRNWIKYIDTCGQLLMTSKERIARVGYIKSDAKLPSCWKFWWGAMVQKPAKGSLISESGRRPWHSESRVHRFQHQKWQHHFASSRTQQCQTGTSNQPYPTRAASMVQANWMCSPKSLGMFHRE